MVFLNSKYFIIILFLFILSVAIILYTLFIKLKLINLLFLNKSQKNLLVNSIETIKKIKSILLIIAILFICISLLDPRWGSKSSNVEMSGIDIVFLFDVSRSMSVSDVKPNRLEYAKDKANSLIDLLTGNRFALAAFAGYGFKIIPMTDDIDAIKNFIKDINVNMIDRKGTHIVDGLKKASELFDKETLTHKLIILFTDGEDLKLNPKKDLDFLVNNSIIVYTIGIGTKNGEKIALYDNDGNFIDYLKHNNEYVISKLDEIKLQEIAKISGGKYYSSENLNINEIYYEINKIEKSKYSSNIYYFMEPQFKYFLIPAILLLLIYLFLPERKYNNNIINKVFLLFLLVKILIPDYTYADYKSKGTKEYLNENYEKASDLFRKALKKEDPKVIYNLGNSYYKMKEYNKALDSYKKITNTEDKNLRNKAFYNLGNTYFQLKDYTNAMMSYLEVLKNEKYNSSLYKKALSNLIYINTQMEQEKQNKENNKNKDQNQEDEKQNKEDKNNQNNEQNKNENKNQNAPNNMQNLKEDDIEKLLDILDNEEKRNMSDLEKNKPIDIPDREW